ncbi:hypothetical protein HID58_063726 [Brassica napus]|uniref:Uncharacterized protein n=1 Tax=Brassica napus TaxID=3708 RepID=A0ABQ7XHN4_BRANA|nr:flocculation protein FLO11-like [Brassica napus]KAH0854550.1 hypothetical protein HID58_063726 [Brassica napus]
MMASTAENEAIVHSTSPQILTTSAAEDQVCDAEMLPVPEDYMTTTTSHDADTVLDQEFVVPFPDPASTLDIHGPARSDQSVQVNHSEAVHENGVQPPNISHGAPLPMGHNPPRHLFSDPYEYELEKIRIEEENLKKSVEEATSQLMAELDRKMAEARSEFDKETQEFDAKVMEVDARMGLVRTGSLLGNAFVSKCSERSASNDLAAVRAMISQHSTQQQQAVQTNTQMSSTAPPRVRPQQESTRLSTSAPPRPSVVSVDDDPVPNSSAPLPHLPRRTTTTQTSPVTQQTVQAHTHVNSTAPTTPPSVTSVEPQTPNSSGPLHHLPRPTTQPSPMSQQTVHVNSTAPTPLQSQQWNLKHQIIYVLLRASLNQSGISASCFAIKPNVNSSTPLPRPSAITEGLPLHSPLSNTPRPRPRPVISNVTPPSSSSPPVRGPAPHILRASAPHLARRPAPHLRQYGSFPAPTSAAAAPTTHPRRSVQEQEQQQQQQGKSNGGLVNLSDED